MLSLRPVVRLPLRVLEMAVSVALITMTAHSSSLPCTPHTHRPLSFMLNPTDWSMCSPSTCPYVTSVRLHRLPDLIRILTDRVALNRSVERLESVPKLQPHSLAEASRHISPFLPSSLTWFRHGRRTSDRGLITASITLPGAVRSIFSSTATSR